MLYRALYLGVSDGPDVEELQENLVALGFGGGISASDHFSAATEAAVRGLAASLGVPATGVVALGDVVVEPGPIRSTRSAVRDRRGGDRRRVGPHAPPRRRGRSRSTSTPSQQSEVKVGDPVTVTLPDNSTTPGVVSSVGTIATAPTSSGGYDRRRARPRRSPSRSPSRTRRRRATSTRRRSTVAITNASVTNALVVPVDALLALSSGGYALEEVASERCAPPRAGDASGSSTTRTGSSRCAARASRPGRRSSCRTREPETSVRARRHRSTADDGAPRRGRPPSRRGGPRTGGEGDPGARGRVGDQDAIRASPPSRRCGG